MDTYILTAVILAALTGALALHRRDQRKRRARHAERIARRRRNARPQTMATVTHDYDPDHPVFHYQQLQARVLEHSAEVGRLKGALRAAELEAKRSLARIAALEAELRYRPDADPIVPLLAELGPMTFDALRFRLNKNDRVDRVDLDRRMNNLILWTEQVRKIIGPAGAALYEFVQTPKSMDAVVRTRAITA